MRCKECPFGAVANYGRVRRRVPESEALSVASFLSVLSDAVADEPRHAPTFQNLLSGTLLAISSRFDYTTKEALLISAHLSTDDVGALRKVWLLNY